MSWLATAVVVAGAGLTAYGQYSAGKSQKAMADYNAQLAENEAIEKRQQTQADIESMRIQKDKMKSRQRAQYAKTGAVVTEGTPLLAQAEEAGLMELDILNRRRTGQMDVQSSLSEAELSKHQGKQAYRAGIIGAGSSLLSGAGSAYGTYKSGT